MRNLTLEENINEIKKALHILSKGHPNQKLYVNYLKFNLFDFL